jgi:hypothetical protein
VLAAADCAKLDCHILERHAIPYAPGGRTRLARSRRLTNDGVGARPDLMRGRFHAYLCVRRHAHAHRGRRNLRRVGCHGASPPHQPLAITHGPNLRVTSGPTECRSRFLKALHQGAAGIGQTPDGLPRCITLCADVGGATCSAASPARNSTQPRRSCLYSCTAA